jgi:ATP-dependent Clp protease protease subunit
MSEENPNEKPDSVANTNGTSSLGEKSLFDSRIILINAPVNSKLSHLVNSQLLAMEQASDKPITIYINCPGGEMNSGYAIFDMIRFIKPEVTTIVAGLAASMGSIIALAAKKENRYALPNAKFLIHQPSIHGGLSGSTSDIEIHAKDIMDAKSQVVDLYVKETGQSRETIQQSIDRDFWMSSQKALEFGLISKILKTRSELK